jgi:hypothetical protein
MFSLPIDRPLSSKLHVGHHCHLLLGFPRTENDRTLGSKLKEMRSCHTQNSRLAHAAHWEPLSVSIEHIIANRLICLP